MAASVAASVVWLTGAEVAVRTSALSCALSALAADVLVVVAATLVSGFLVGTGAFDVTTTNFTMVKDKVLLPYITLLTAYNTAALTETPRPFGHESRFKGCNS